MNVAISVSAGRVDEMTLNPPRPSPETLHYWLPGLVAGALAWGLFVAVGGTPIIRAGGMALVIMGMAMILRQMGAPLAVIGALSLALCPAFWSQTGGTESLDPLLTVGSLVAAGALILLAWRFSTRLYIGLIGGFLAFALLFWTQLAAVGSLRLTTFSAVWLLYLLVDGLYRTNPRPDGPPPAPLARQHIWGPLALYTVGVVNDPLFAFLAPALLLGLLLSRAPVGLAYWAALTAITALGVYGVIAQYADSGWWLFPVAEAEARGVRVPFMMAGGWREASRWLGLFDLLIGQFTLIGLPLGLLGLSRLSRWYPPIGTVTLIAFASYMLFGLVYFGRDGAVLLLPLLMIQVFWMTYAVSALRDWLVGGLGRPPLRWLVVGAYSLLPLALLVRIAVGV